MAKETLYKIVSCTIRSLRQLNIKVDRNLVDDLGSSSRKVVIKICFRCCKDLFKKRRKLLNSLHNVNSGLSFLCRPNQTTHAKDQGSIAFKKGVDCANSVENIVAEKNSIRTNLVTWSGPVRTCFLLNTKKNRSEHCSTCSFLEKVLHHSFVLIKDPFYVENELGVT